VTYRVKEKTKQVTSKGWWQAEHNAVLLHLFLDPEEGGDMFLWNIGLSGKLCIFFKKPKLLFIGLLAMQLVQD
jgi:hypothetical protein